MTLYKVDRDLAGWDEHELYAAAFRAKFCATWFDGMRWDTSYFNPADQQMACIWEARDEADIYAHGRASGLPVTAVAAVMQIDPDMVEGLPLDPATVPMPDRTLFFRAERASVLGG